MEARFEKEAYWETTGGWNFTWIFHRELFKVLWIEKRPYYQKGTIKLRPSLLLPFGSAEYTDLLGTWETWIWKGPGKRKQEHVRKAFDLLFPIEISTK